MNLFDCARHSGEAWLRRWALAAIFLLAAAILSGCSGGSGGSGQQVTHSIEDICGQAQALVDKGQPQEAVNLIESTRKKYATAKASTVTAGPPDPSTYCQQAYTNANYQLAEQVNGEAAPANFPQSWVQSKELWATPPIGWGLSVASGWIVSAFLAALLARFKLFELNIINSRRATHFGIAGIFLLAIGVIISAIIVSCAAIGMPSPIWLLFTFLGMTLVAIIFLALALANRIALQITVRNREGTIDQAKTSNLVVLIRNLGFNQLYTGLSVAMESPTNILKNSTVQGTPENRIIADLQFIFTTVFGVHPWRISIDESMDGVLVIIINRNGRSRANERISASAMSEYAVDENGKMVGTPSTNSYKMAAALIVETLSQSYDDLDDLCGATKWQSIGLTYVADAEKDREKRLAFLKRAVALDPENSTAQLLLQAHIYREETSGERLDYYALWLLEYAEKALKASQASNKLPKSGYERLYRLCLSNYIHAVLNLRNCGGFESYHLGAHSEAIKLLDSYGKMEPKDSYHKTVVNMTEIAKVGLNLESNIDELRLLEKTKRRNFHPIVRYNLACVLIISPEAVADPILFENALGHLAHALQDPVLREWAAKDPTLARVALTGLQKEKFDAIMDISVSPGHAGDATLPNLP